MMRKNLSLTSFFVGALLFVVNLNYDLTPDQNKLLFLLSVFLTFGAIIYQLFVLKYAGPPVLMEIFFVSLLLHLVYQTGYYGLRGSDSYIDYNFLKSILARSGFVLGTSADGWPMLHILAASIINVTKIEPIVVAKYLPSLISSTLILPLYLLSLEVSADKKTALFSCLIYSTIPQFVRFESLFVRESFSLFVMVFLFYVFYLSRKREDIRYVLLSMILIPVMVFSHHFTAFMFLILIGLPYVSSAIMDRVIRRDNKEKKALSRLDTFILLFFVALFAYWTYNAIFILKSIASFVSSVFSTPETATYAEQISLNTPIITMRGNIIYYGFYFFHLTAAIVLTMNLIDIVRTKAGHRILELSFSLYFMFCGLYSFVTLYILNSPIFPDRLIASSWLFGIIPLAGVLPKIKGLWPRRVFILFLIVFMAYNIYNIEPSFYSHTAHKTGLVSGAKEYSIARDIMLPGTYYGYGGVIGAVYDVQGITQRLNGKDLMRLGDLRNTSAVAIISEPNLNNNLGALRKKSYGDYLKVVRILSYKDEPGINKICDLGDVYILERK